MIIFGTRGVTTSVIRGTFHCPRCAQSPYDHKRVRRFFTLYFIPLIPLDVLGEYVECGQCSSTWDVEVLSLNPDADRSDFEAEFERAIRRVMVLMVAADGAVEDAEIQQVQEIYAAIAKVELTEADVRAEIATALEEGLTVEAYLQDMAGHLNDNGKEMVFKAALAIAASDGNIAPEEAAMLDDIARALEISRARSKELLAA